MADPGQEAEKVGEAELPNLTNQAENGRDQLNNENPSQNNREPWAHSPSYNGSEIPYPFDLQSSLQHEGTSYGMYHDN